MFSTTLCSNAHRAQMMQACVLSFEIQEQVHFGRENCGFNSSVLKETGL